MNLLPTVWLLPFGKLRQGITVVYIYTKYQLLRNTWDIELFFFLILFKTLSKHINIIHCLIHAAITNR